VAETPIEQSFGMAMQLADMNAQKGNLAKAVDYSSKVMQVYGTRSRRAFRKVHGIMNGQGVRLHGRERYRRRITEGN